MRGRGIEFLALLFLACLLAGAAHAENRCRDQRWDGRAVLVLAPGDDQGIGGAGHGGDDHGIGGTGHSGEGIGGTGARMAQDDGIGGTGIVGIIAGFASICVDGMEIHYDAATPTQLDGTPAPTSVLALGQKVAVAARDLGGGEYQATGIAVLNAVVGAVEASGDGLVRVLGQDVRVPGGVSGILPGMRLAIAGERDPDGVIRASRIALAAAGARDSVLGRATVTGMDRFSIGGLEVRARPEDMPGVGEEVLVRGQAREGVLRADKVERRPIPDLPRGLERPSRDALRGDASARVESARPERMRPELPRMESPRPMRPPRMDLPRSRTGR